MSAELHHHHHAGDGPVLVDVGGRVGALVLYAEPTMRGAEIDISPLGQPDRRQHVAVHPRRAGTRVVHAAVYPSLPAGTYELWDPAGRPALTVVVEGGRVTEADWPAA